MNVVECGSMRLKNNRPLKRGVAQLVSPLHKRNVQARNPVRDNLRRNITIGYRSH